MLYFIYHILYFLLYILSIRVRVNPNPKPLHYSQLILSLYCHSNSQFSTLIFLSFFYITLQFFFLSGTELGLESREIKFISSNSPSINSSSPSSVVELRFFKVVFLSPLKSSLDAFFSTFLLARRDQGLLLVAA